MKTVAIQDETRGYALKVISVSDQESERIENYKKAGRREQCRCHHNANSHREYDMAANGRCLSPGCNCRGFIYWQTARR